MRTHSSAHPPSANPLKPQYGREQPVRGTTPAGQPCACARPLPLSGRAGGCSTAPAAGGCGAAMEVRAAGTGLRGRCGRGRLRGLSCPCPPEPVRFSGSPPSGLRVLSVLGSPLGAGLLGDAPSPGVKLLCSLRRASSNKVWQGCELLRWQLAGKDVRSVEGEGIKTNKLFLDWDDRKESSSSCIFPLSYNAENYELPGTLKTSF